MLQQTNREALDSLRRINHAPVSLQIEFAKTFNAIMHSLTTGEGMDRTQGLGEEGPTRVGHDTAHHKVHVA